MVNTKKPGSRAAQRVEAVSNQLVPSAIDSVRNSEDKMSDTSNAANMPTTRRIVTGHDSKGLAVIESDTLLSPRNPLLGDGSPPSGLVPGFTTIAKTSQFPDVSVSQPFVDLHGKKIPLSDDSGVTCRIVDFPPVPTSARDEVNIMHRTQSVDFGVVLQGKIWLVMDGGEEREMVAGDVCVQRGTNHAWENRSGENARMMFVLVPSEPVKNQETGEVLVPTDTKLLTD